MYFTSCTFLDHILYRNICFVLVAVVVVVGLDVDRGYGLGFVVGAYTYL
jgi:hypothetical protein